jgi:uncharacterized membrane protein YbhN (UPF0104 family)
MPECGVAESKGGNPAIGCPSLWRGWIAWIAKAGVAVGLLVWLVLSDRLDFIRLIRVGPSWSMATLVAFALASMVLPAWRWQLLLKAQGLSEPFGRILRLTWVGYFALLVLPGTAGGDVAKSYLLLRLQPEARVRAVSTVLADRVVGVYALLLLGGMSVGWLAWQGGMPPAVGAMAGVMLALLLGATLGGAVLWIRRCRQVVFAVLPRAWAEAWTQSADLYQARIGWLLAALVSSLLSSTLFVLALGSAAGCIGDNVSLSALFLAGPLVVLANCLPISPGGIGVGEAASEALFGAFGVSGGAEMMMLLRIVIALVSLPGCFGINAERREKEAVGQQRSLEKPTEFGNAAASWDQT